MDEFDEICQNNPSITVSYYETSKRGFITEDQIKNLIGSMKDPDVYICGPTGFEALISQTLEKIGFDQNRIFIEKFG